MKLLLETTGEYGWSHEGHSSWGDDWHRMACNEALEQIRTRIASMVNLKELETFTNQDLKNNLNVEGAFSKDSSSFKIGSAHDKSKEEKQRWLNENNFLIDVSDVSVKPNTDWTKTEKNWKGERTWKASATLLYRVRIFGKE